MHTVRTFTSNASLITPPENALSKRAESQFIICDRVDTIYELCQCVVCLILWLIREQNWCKIRKRVHKCAVVESVVHA